MEESISLIEKYKDVINFNRNDNIVEVNEVEEDIDEWDDEDYDQKKLYRNFMLTCNNYTEKHILLFQEVDTGYKVYGKEVGEKNKVPHLQCFVHFKNAKSKSRVINLFPGFHVMICKFPERAILYCKKGSQSKKEWLKYHHKGPNYGKDADIYEDGSFMTQKEKGDAGKKIYEDLKNDINSGKTFEEIDNKYFSLTLRYEESIKNRIEEVDNKRTYELMKESFKEEVVLPLWHTEFMKCLDNLKPKEILWIHDNGRGQTKKSSVAEYLEFEHNAFVTNLATVKSSVECKYQYRKQKLIVIDISREDFKYLSYGLIEQFSDGRIESTKYRPSKKYAWRPKVVIFSNYPCKDDALTKSRLITKIIDDKDKLVDPINN